MASVHHAGAPENWLQASPVFESPEEVRLYSVIAKDPPQICDELPSQANRHRESLSFSVRVDM